VYEESVFDRRSYLAGTPASRAAAFQNAWADPSIGAVIAARGGYGSVHLLPLLDPRAFAGEAKAFIGYSDNTSILTWLNQACGMVAFHGPMVEGRFSAGPSAYDRDSFARCLSRAEPAGRIAHPFLEVLNKGEASGMLVGGTLTKLTASLGTPYAFAPPPGCVLFIDEVAERPYRLDRMLTQLRLAGVMARASAVVFGVMPNCDEPGGATMGREVVAELMAGFPGPVLYGLPSGHTDEPTITLPFGVRARVLADATPALVIEEAAVTDTGS
jgi:muramoyltetrapeptide carboxypeptidase